MNAAKAPPIILSPAAAAARLSIPVPGLVALIRRHKYRFTELALGGRPGDRGRNRWGLSEAQLEAIVRGQERGFVDPSPAPDGAALPSPVSPDGRSRLRRGRAARP